MTSDSNNYLLPAGRMRWLFAAFILLYLLSVLWNLGYLELAGEEPRRAIISLEMLQSGNYFKPTQMGWDYYNKPVLFNWILCTMIKLTGSSSEFVLRLPSFLFFLLWGVAHYRVSKKFLPRNVALLSSLFMFTSAEIYFYGLGNGAEIDIFYSFIVYLQAVSIFYFFHQKNWTKLYLLSYFFCAVGFLTKGFPSLVFQALTLAAICHYAKSIRALFQPAHLLGILVFTIFAGAYFYSYSQYNSPQRLLINLLNESLIKSGIGERSNKLFDKAVGYPFLLFKLLAPWSLLFLFLRRSIWREAIKNPFVRFSCLFIAYNIWVYWFTGQPKARYVYMFVPFACTMLSFIYWELVKRKSVPLSKLLTFLGFVFGIILLAVIALPFFEAVPSVLVFLISVSLVVFLYFYFQTTKNKIWLFITGVVLLRLVYSSLFIPIQYEKIANYSRNTKKAAEKLRSGQLTFWAPPAQFTFAINSKLFSKTFESIPAPALLHAQVPYYYHKYTGNLLLYDTALVEGKNYLSFETDTRNLNIDSIFSFQNRKEPGRLIVYHLKNP